MVRSSLNYIFIDKQLPIIRKLIKYSFTDSQIAEYLGLSIDSYLKYNVLVNEK